MVCYNFLIVIGENIRQTRTLQKRSLADVAKKAKISVATLSRIENGKQTLDLAMFLTLARILATTPHDLLGAENPSNGDHDSNIAALVKKIAAFEARERAKLWRELATAKRKEKLKGLSVESKQLALQLEELLAQIEFMRAELENVHKRLSRA